MTHTGTPHPDTASGSDRPDVELRLPADSAYVSVLRTTSAGLAARLDLTIDAIEDLRIAVGEASALLLESARPGADLHAGFRLSPGSIAVTIAVDADHPAEPDRDGFAWLMLSTLASTADAWASDDRVTVALTLGGTEAV